MEDNYLRLCYEDLWFLPTDLKAVLLLGCSGGVEKVLGKFTISSWRQRRDSFPVLYTSSCLLFFLSHFSILTYLLESGLSHVCFPLLFACLPSSFYTGTQRTGFQIDKKRGKYYPARKQQAKLATYAFSIFADCGQCYMRWAYSKETEWNSARGQKEGEATGNPVGKLQIQSLMCCAQSCTSFHLFFRVPHVSEVTFPQKLFDK